MVATGGNDNLVKLWSAADGKPVRTFTGHANRVYSVLFHPDGKRLISGDLMGSVRVWELASGKEVGVFDAKELHTYDARPGRRFRRHPRPSDQPRQDTRRLRRTLQSDEPARGRA